MSGRENILNAKVQCEGSSHENEADFPLKIDLSG